MNSTDGGCGGVVAVAVELGEVAVGVATAVVAVLLVPVEAVACVLAAVAV
jgi:hypothetical protein